MNPIQKYFRIRQNLIDQYIKGDMTKKEYLQRNYEAVLEVDIQPFRKIDSIEKGLFNYQYYNALAKQMKSFSSGNGIEYARKQEYLEKADQYYYKKDQATLGLLRFLDYRNVAAYFIQVRSKHLKGKLFEVVLLEHCHVILHSTNTLILKKLREECVFEEEIKKSLIDHYINQKY